MKKKFLAFLTSLICMVATVTAISSCAENTCERITIESDNFSYTFEYTGNTPYHYSYFESESVDADLIVVGIYYCDDDPNSISYLLHKLNHPSNYLVQISYSSFDVEELQLGDLLKVDGGLDGIHEAESYPPFLPAHGSYVGNGLELFGKDFIHVIRREMVILQERSQPDFSFYDNIDLIKGDATIDDKLNILDSIAINKTLLAGSPLCDYAKLAGDVNENGSIDSDDSLCILKETIGLTENFE